MIRIDAIWLAMEPIDMRVGQGGRVVQYGEAALCLFVCQSPRHSHEGSGA